MYGGETGLNSVSVKQWQSVFGVCRRVYFETVSDWGWLRSPCGGKVCVCDCHICVKAMADRKLVGWRDWERTSDRTELRESG